MAQTGDDLALAPGDYTAVGATMLTFAPGVTSQTFTVQVVGDTLNESNETFLVTLSRASQRDARRSTRASGRSRTTTRCRRSRSTT